MGKVCATLVSRLHNPPHLILAGKPTPLKEYLIKHGLAFLLSYSVQGLSLKVPTLDIALVDTFSLCCKIDCKSYSPSVPVV